MRKSWTHYRELIVDELAKLKLQGEPNELYEPITYILSLGGKRIRPVLCLMAAEMFGGESKRALSLALGIEVFHNFTLVHDDIMDKAPLRRGRPTVHEKWNRDIAILSGDVMFVKAYELICNTETEYLAELLKLFNKTAIEVCEGQQFDMNFEFTPEVLLSDYIKMIRLKTAVLLACSLKMGAIASGASLKDANLIYEFGQNVGIAFQIQDDYLDAYGNEEQFGKRLGGDIISNKKTFLLLKAIEKADKTRLKELNFLLSGKLDDNEKISRTLEIYDKLEIPEITKNSMNDYFNRGLKAMQGVSVRDELKKPLIEVAEMLMMRDE